MEEHGQIDLNIKLGEYAERRSRLLEKIPSSSVVILPGEIEKIRNGDNHYPFRQDSHFYYLTGFCESQALLILLKGSEGDAEYILFSRARNPEEALWIGKRAGQEGALQQFGADRAYPLEEIDKIVPKLLEDKQQMIYSYGQYPDWDDKIVRWLNVLRKQNRSGIRFPNVCLDLLSLIQEQRLFKSSSEISMMRRAASISAKAHSEVMKTCSPNKMEYELESTFLQECYKQGGRAVAYPTIVGGGKNACILHYVNNDEKLKSGDLVLIDAGVEYQYYASDITRTFPVNGKFSPEQKLIYELVLEAQVSAIHEIKPGLVWNELQDIIVKTLVTGLVSLGLLKGKVEALIKENAYRKFYMHSSGHWLGLDVHDVGQYKMGDEWRKLEPGMVLTVEPGIYVSEDKDIDKRWWGIGVRIEDDVLVTERGYEVLSKDVPKTVKDIETLMQAGEL